MRTAKGSLALVALLAGSVLAIVSTPGSAQAQSVTFSAKVPFEFQIGSTRMPPGTYTVHRTGDAIQVSDGNGHSAFVLSDAIAKPKNSTNSQLVFNRYGDRMFLAQVQWNGYPDARGVKPSKDEIALAKASKETSLVATNSTK